MLDWFNESSIIQVPITRDLDSNYSDDDLDRVQAELERRRPRQTRSTRQPVRVTTTDRRCELDQIEASDRLANAQNTLEIRQSVQPGTYQHWLMTLSAKRDLLQARLLGGDKTALAELRSLPAVHERWPGYPSS